MTMLTIGTDITGSTPATLDASRFNRHTFWCGQSGSGKTFALGVVLEQLLLHTELPILILDPNADFVRLREARPEVTPQQRERRNILPPCIPVHGKLPTISRSPPLSPSTIIKPPA